MALKGFEIRAYVRRPGRKHDEVIGEVESLKQNDLVMNLNQRKIDLY